MTAIAAVCLSMMSMSTAPPASAFDDDVAFLNKHVKTYVIGAGKSKVALVAAYQGRVMTSTDGVSGLSYGWINRELIAERKLRKHINAFGGEDRFWLGPEGGQFSIFFKNGDPFDLEHWQTPAPIDSDPYNLVSKTATQATFSKTFRLENYMGNFLQVQVNRVVRALDNAAAARLLRAPIGAGVNIVAYETVNKVKNMGAQAWDDNRGMLSIWILGMFNASPSTTVAIPFRPGPEETMGPVVNADYFGEVPEERLKVQGNHIFFKGDAKYRSKIGVSPKRARPVMGSYDATNRVLTIVQYTLPGDTTKYVNSMWEIQAQPFAGDAVNSYNDGPPPTGGPQLGKFYELESSSPALALKPGQEGSHTHRTFHLQGDEKALEAIAKATLGVGLAEIKTALK
jgi:hypothetical protein